MGMLLLSVPRASNSASSLLSVYWWFRNPFILLINFFYFVLNDLLLFYVYYFFYLYYKFWILYIENILMIQIFNTIIKVLLQQLADILYFYIYFCCCLSSYDYKLHVWYLQTSFLKSLRSVKPIIVTQVLFYKDSSVFTDANNRASYKKFMDFTM